MTALLEAAVMYARSGISVVPLHTPISVGCSCKKGSDCLSAGKHTRIEWKPYQERCATLGEIETWWSRWPDANVGIVTGTVSRLCVVGGTSGIKPFVNPLLRDGNEKMTGFGIAGKAPSSDIGRGPYA